jgi:predicted ATPase
LLKKKTLGNPFYLGQYLRQLYSAEMLSYNWHKGCWEYDLGAIACSSLCENVAALMTAALSKMDAAVRAKKVQ